MKESLLPSLCTRCAHWRIEPAALDLGHRQILRDVSGLPGGRGLEYGKCTAATFTGQEGEIISHEPGKAGGQPCDERGGDGELLFKPAPEED